MCRWLITLFVIVFISGVSLAESTPESVVKGYLDAVRANDYSKACTYVSESEKDIMEWLEWLNFIRREAPPKLLSMINLAHSLSRHEIISVEITGNEAVVKLDTTVPDMENILAVTHSEDIIRAMKDGGILPTRHREGKLGLKEEPGGWKITYVKVASESVAADLAIDLAEQILGEEEAARLAKLIKEYRVASGDQR